MRITVLVPTWRRPEELAHCLDGLEAQSRAPDEVVVVAREEDAETWRLLRERGADGRLSGERAAGGLPLRGVEVGAPGVVHSLAAGFEAVEGELVAITDDDSVPRPDWLERIEALFESDPGAGGVGGRDFVHEGGGVLDGARPEVGRVRWFGRVVGNHHLGVGPAREVDLLKGVNMAFRAEALRGFAFAPGLRGGGAQMHWEVDLCLGVKRSGWRLLYDPAVAVDHYPAQRFDEDQRSWRPLEALSNEAFNLSYLLLRRLPPGRAALALAYGLLVGTRETPGLGAALERALRGRRTQGALAACERARVEALRESLRDRDR